MRGNEARKNWHSMREKVRGERKPPIFVLDIIYSNLIRKSTSHRRRSAMSISCSMRSSSTMFKRNLLETYSWNDVVSSQARRHAFSLFFKRCTHVIKNNISIFNIDFHSAWGRSSGLWRLKASSRNIRIDDALFYIFDINLRMSEEQAITTTRHQHSTISVNTPPIRKCIALLLNKCVMCGGACGERRVSYCATERTLPLSIG